MFVTMIMETRASENVVVPRFGWRLLAVGFVTSTFVSEAVISAPNILLMISDDMGVETLAAYGLGENPPTTPNLDEMAREGMLFKNFWSQPVCSPTRATVMTGRYGFRTGVGRPVTANGPMPDAPEIPAWALPNVESGEGGGGGMAGMGMGGGLQDLPRYGLGVDEYTLPHAFDANPDLGYATAAIGKWHLADERNGWLDHPNRIGFDYFSGGIEGSVASYFAWNKTVNGEVTGTVGYTPVDKIDDAIAWIGAQGDTPWLMWLSFNLPHGPLHSPPDESREGRSEDDFPAMIEALDMQIGRVLASLEPDVRENTYVVFMGDNGTAGGSVRAPFQTGRAKGAVYQGGVNVPFIVTGPGVQRGTVSGALVNSTDLFVTAMEMAGIDSDETIPDDVRHDSVSFLATLSDPDISAREWVFADEFFGGFAGIETEEYDYAMRNERYKLLRFNGTEEFYDLETDPYEHENLLMRELNSEERAQLEALREEVATLRASE